MNTKMTAVVFGALLIFIALILGGVQLLHLYNIYGRGSNKWYFYGGVGAVGLAGMLLATWGLLKREISKQTSQ